MKKLFIHAKSKLSDIKFDTTSLPKQIGLVTTIQYLEELPKIAEFLKSKSIEAELGGQVLGCDSSSADKLRSNDILYLGSGEFHPIGIAIRSNKQVFKLHPQSMQITKVTEDQILKIQKKKQGMLLKFHTSEIIGVLLTTKDGQSRVQGGRVKAENLEKQFPDKKFYYFISDTLDFAELENFNFIECWVNTMCPRIMEDVKVLNLEDIITIMK